MYLENEEFHSNMKDIWTESPEKRSTYGRAIINLRLNEKVNYFENSYLHTFKQNCDDTLVSKSGKKINCD